MRRIVVTEFVSLDGVMEDPGGAEGTPDGGWAFKFERGPEGDKYKFDELMAADAMLLGRVTYQGFAQAWPSMTDEVGFADKMNGMRKYVVSSTLEQAEWKNSQILRGDVADEVRKLKAQEGGDILVAGSAQLAHALQDADLVDEYRLMVYPTVLGSGQAPVPRRRSAGRPGAGRGPPVRSGRDHDAAARPRRRRAGGMTPVPPARHLLRAKDLIDARYRERLEVEALARASHLSIAHFSREFRRAFGETPHQYLLTRRLERAAALLRNTDHSVVDICMAVGLRSVGSFTTSFGRAYGRTPTAYRAAHPPAASRPPIPGCVMLAWARPRSSSFREDGAAAAG